MQSTCPIKQLLPTFQMNNLTNLPPNNVSSVLNLAHKMAEENREDNLMQIFFFIHIYHFNFFFFRSPLLDQTIRSNSISWRESLPQKSFCQCISVPEVKGKKSWPELYKLWWDIKTKWPNYFGKNGMLTFVIMFVWL